MTLFGFPVRIHLSFVVVCLLIGALSVREPILILAWVLVVGISILVHELGHAFMGRAFGRKARIELHGMGGVCIYEPGPAFSTRRRILLALAGPMAGFVFGGLILLLAMYTTVFDASKETEVLLLFLLWVNFGWGLLNLIPMLPLDGGMVMHAIIRHYKGEEASVRPALMFSIGVAIAATVAAVLYDFTFAAILAAWFGFSNYEQLRTLQTMNVEDPLRRRFLEAVAALNMGQPEIALRLAEDVMENAKSPGLYAESTKLVAGILALQLRYDEALEALQKLPPTHEAPAFLEAQLLLRTGQAERAVPRARAAFREEPTTSTARIFAESLAASGRARELTKLMEHESEHLDLASYEAVQTTAYERGDFDISLDVAEAAFSRWRDPRVAFNGACALVALQRKDEAMDWLERAVDEGWDDHEALDDPDLEALQSDPNYGDRLQALVDKIRQESAGLSRMLH